MEAIGERMPTTASKQIAPEFGSWPLSENQIKQIEDIKWQFDELQTAIVNVIPPSNARYAAVVRTKLEEACLFAVKGIAKN